MDVELRQQSGDGVTILAPTGRIDSSNAAAFERDIMAQIEAVAGPVLVDLGQLRYISSAGLRVVLLAAKKQRKAAHDFALCSPSPDIREVFEVSGFSKIIDIFADRAEALAALSR